MVVAGSYHFVGRAEELARLLAALERVELASVFHERGWQADDGEVGPFWGGHARLVSDLA